MTPWHRALRDAGWVILVLGVLAVAYLLMAGYGEGETFATGPLPPEILPPLSFLERSDLLLGIAVVVVLVAMFLHILLDPER